jgi:hypothetical protein
MNLTLSLPSSNYYTSPPSLSARNLLPPYPAISCVFYIILPIERKFYPQVGNSRNRFCRRSARVFYDILPPSRIKSHKAFLKTSSVCIGILIFIAAKLHFLNNGLYCNVKIFFRLSRYFCNLFIGSQRLIRAGSFREHL